MQIQRLDPKEYAGRRFTMRYTTGGYYHVTPEPEGFRLQYRTFDPPVQMSFDDVFFNQWLENPVAFGAFDGGTLLGFVEGSLEIWNNRFRISNICVWDADRRRSGIGSALMECILREATHSGARMAVLETQSCNENSIAFYRKWGFEIIGFDLYAYTNTDPQRHEIRIEMGKALI